MEFSLSTIRREMVEISTFTADSRTARGTGECSNTGFDQFAAPLIRKDQIRATTKNAPNQAIQLGAPPWDLLPAGSAGSDGRASDRASSSASFVNFRKTAALDIRLWYRREPADQIPLRYGTAYLH